MFKNYIITALRNIKRYKIYSLINIIGLANCSCAGLSFGILRINGFKDLHTAHPSTLLFSSSPV